ncbi:LPS assembly lipoprotein LptE [Sessilibacter corallicola]|uniref:LPS-assembly lipoprotein LptE n=1 Tax=Sessilibacter corallicola TaxID=2904075 RepID=UPI001E561B1E|nr:LPS assembly lipoprotein LptE [Sessilibacter corallicola]MCE2027200.1 LPS assembly lipoprotein LptE [Sessilibacter corallicola]
MVFIRFLITAIICFSISACGWHLRGSVSLPEDLRELALESDGVNATVIREIERAFELNKIELVDAQYAPYRMTLSDEFEERRISAVSSDGLAERISLTLSVAFVIENQDGFILGEPGKATVTRSYGFDRQNVAGKAAEEQLVKQEMRQELGQQLLRRYRFLAANGTVTKPVDNSVPVEAIDSTQPVSNP